MLISLLVAGALVLSDDPDGVVATAPTGHQSVPVGAEAPVAPDVPSVSTQTLTPHGLTTDQQIDRWIGQRAQGEKPFSNDVDPWATRDDRKVHGQVSAAVGTGDFTAYSAEVSLPIGENSRLNLSYSESKNDPFGYGYGYGHPGQGYGYGRRSRDYGVDSRSFGIGYRYDSTAGDRESRFGPSWDRTSRLRREEDVSTAVED